MDIHSLSLKRRSIVHYVITTGFTSFGHIPALMLYNDAHVCTQCETSGRRHFVPTCWYANVHVSTKASNHVSRSNSSGCTTIKTRTFSIGNLPHASTSDNAEELLEKETASLDAAPTSKRHLRTNPPTNAEIASSYTQYILPVSPFIRRNDPGTSGDNHLDDNSHPLTGANTVAVTKNCLNSSGSVHVLRPPSPVSPPPASEFIQL